MPYKDKAKQAACAKAYREANSERKAVYDKAYRAANSERIAATNKAYREANKERRAAWKRAWKAANPERAAAYQRKHTTGWTDEQYRAKLAEQMGRCAICDTDRCSQGRAMSADHCHRTGKPRGILCNRCNRAIGLLGDNAEALGRAFAYLVRYETDIKWEPIENDDNKHTINEGAVDNTPDLQPTHERCGDRVRNLGADDRQSH